MPSIGRTAHAIETSGGCGQFRGGMGAGGPGWPPWQPAALAVSVLPRDAEHGRGGQMGEASSTGRTTARRRCRAPIPPRSWSTTAATTAPAPCPSARQPRCSVRPSGATGGGAGARPRLRIPAPSPCWSVAAGAPLMWRRLKTVLLLFAALRAAGYCSRLLPSRPLIGRLVRSSVDCRFWTWQSWRGCADWAMPKPSASKWSGSWDGASPRRLTWERRRCSERGGPGPANRGSLVLPLASPYRVSAQTPRQHLIGRWTSQAHASRLASNVRHTSDCRGCPLAEILLSRKVKR
jgi:hypothetical protein